ncbi:MAG: hypothetical protein ABI604_11240, partial [Nitrospirota bacterium]
GRSEISGRFFLVPTHDVCQPTVFREYFDCAQGTVKAWEIPSRPMKAPGGHYEVGAFPLQPPHEDLVRVFKKQKRPEIS